MKNAIRAFAVQQTLCEFHPFSNSVNVAWRLHARRAAQILLYYYKPHLHHSKSEIHSTRDFTLCRHSGKTKRAHLRGLRSSGFSRTQIVHLLKRLQLQVVVQKSHALYVRLRHVSPIRSACARITHGLGTRDKYWGRALHYHTIKIQ